MANPQSEPTLRMILANVEDACKRQGELSQRAGEIGDYIGGGTPRGVSTEARDASEPPGALNRIMHRLRDLQSEQAATSGELNRIDSLTGRSGGEIKAAVVGRDY